MDLTLLDYNKLNDRLPEFKTSWDNPSKPFRYVYFDNFLNSEIAEKVLSEYPDIHQGWNYKTYINQRNKFAMNKFDGSAKTIQRLVEELNSLRFTEYLTRITGIPTLLPDAELFGGGLHQSVNGAFLDVHVDFNIHPTTRFHRRLNLIVFFNKQWKPEYNGNLELWDMEKKERIENITPAFNRCVIFETNEMSYHGHPIPLVVPEGVTRKSLALYFYTVERPSREVSEAHNTRFINTTGGSGMFKNLKSSIQALKERIFSK